MNIQYKKNTLLLAFEGLLTIVGIVLIVIGIILVIRTISFNNKSEEIEVEVDSCDKNITTDSSGTSSVEYITYVNYTYYGQKYDHVLLLGLNRETVSGDRIRVRINTENHNDVRYMNQTTFGVVIMIIGGLLLAGGIGYLFVITILSSNEYKEIVKQGRKIEATITKVYPYRNVYNPKYQYYLVDCECMEKVFTSKPYRNGEDISEGDKVPVYYTSIRKNKYFVDLENTIINKKKNDDNWRFK